MELLYFLIGLSLLFVGVWLLWFTFKLLFFTDRYVWRRNSEISALLRRYNRGKVTPEEREQVASLVRSGLVERRGLVYRETEVPGEGSVFSPVRLSDRAVEEVWR